MAICPNKNSELYKKLVEELGGDDMAHAAWSRINLEDLKATDIIDTENIQKQILENQKRVRSKTDDGQHYIIDNSLYKRVTNVIPNDFDGDSSLYENSRTAGNTMDSISKTYLESGTAVKPEGISDEAFDHAVAALKDIKANIEANEEELIGTSLVLFDTDLKIAGEVDILTVSKNGDYNIYDIKTSTKQGWDNYTSSYKGKLTKADNHINQLSAYRNLFFNQYGIKAAKLAILPFELVYDKDGIISKAGRLEQIRLAYTSTIEKRIPTSETMIASEFNENTSRYAREKQFLDQRIKRLYKDLSKFSGDDAVYKTKLDEIRKLEEDVNKLKEHPTPKGFEEMGRGIIEEADNYITRVESNDNPELKENWLNYISDIIDIYHNDPHLANEALQLQERFQKLITANISDKVNEHATEKELITIEEIDDQNEDISTFTAGTGSLSDLPNYIGRTIGLEIKTAQNNIAIQNIKDKDEIGKFHKDLEDYCEKTGIKMDDAWDQLTDNTNYTIELARPFYKNGDVNPKFTHIENTPELLAYYNYYQKKLMEKMDHSGVYYTGGKYFIANLHKESVKSWFQSFNPFKTRIVGEARKEDMNQDKIPIKYDNSLAPDKKNKNLSVALLSMALHTNEHAEMSRILPGLRIMQDHLKFDKNNPTSQRQFKTSNNPNKMINAENTHLWKMINDIINMQVFGRMKNEQGQFVYGTKIDTNGNITQEYADFRQIGDDLLRWNSLLRIGFSPISGGANLLFGDITNTLEAVGGRFFNFKQLHQAGLIYLKQVLDKDSTLYRIQHELNFLQEQNEYVYLEELRVGKKKGLSAEQLQELAYTLQKRGENWIQSRVAMAIMIKDDYLTKDGILTDKWEKATAFDKQQLTDKIQRLNHLNHGRYTTKEAAAWTQNILFRMISQFRKYIPAAIEARFGSYNPHDVRLGVDTEGRYNTLGRTVLKKTLTDPIQALQNLLLPIYSMEKALAKGNLTEMEVYNMRKTMIEVILATGASLLYMGLRSGDDEERKKRLRNPIVKTGLTLLNRATGDLTYFMDPTNIIQFGSNLVPMTKLVKDIGNTIKYTIDGYPFYVGKWEYKTGSYKGRNKFYKTVIGEIPGTKSLQDVWRLSNENMLEELN